MPARAIPPRKRAPEAIWSYFQPGFSAPITGKSYQDLLDAILKFRIDHNLDTADPKQDYEDYIGHNWPHFSTQKAERQAAAAQAVEDSKASNKARSLLDEVRLKNKLWGAQKESFATRDEAEARAEICASCHNNQKVGSITLCSPCVKDLNRKTTILTGNRATKAEYPLAYCVSLLHDNRTAVWMDFPRLGQSLKRIDEAPAFCWLKRDYEEKKQTSEKAGGDQTQVVPRPGVDGGVAGGKAGPAEDGRGGGANRDQPAAAGPDNPAHAPLRADGGEDPSLDAGLGDRKDIGLGPGVRLVGTDDADKSAKRKRKRA